MVLAVSENIENLWDAWNIRAFIILSFLAQAFLTLFAPLRKRLGRKWGTISCTLIWLAYLLADWVAALTIGSILSNQIKSSSKSDDIQVFWAPFLLLHLGGPDTITSFALEDNEFWIRHLLGLILQVGSTLYVFFVSLPENKLWPPTLLVLIASIIKYAERSCAFYLASFDHFGDNCTWAAPGEGTGELPIPAEFKNVGTADSLPKEILNFEGLEPELRRNQLQIQRNPNFDIYQYFADSNPKSIVKAAVYLFGTIRHLVGGSFISKSQLRKSFANLAGSRNNDRSSARDALQKVEIELSLLYEALHTKWTVLVSKIGCFGRILNFGCILGALFSFSMIGKHYKWGVVDAWLTYGLLIGALSLDFISLILLFVISDWFFIAHFRDMGSKSVEEFINRRRWSNAVPQLNFITYIVKGVHPNWLQKSLYHPNWEKNYPSLSTQNFTDYCWGFIFEELKKFLTTEHDEDWLTMSKKILDEIHLGDTEEGRQENEARKGNFSMTEELDFTQSLLTLHIATELFVRNKPPPTASSSSGSNDDIDHRRICKLFSDYMLYLVMMEPSMMAPMLNSWKKLFNDTYEDTKSILEGESVSNEDEASKRILSKFEQHKLDGHVLYDGSNLARSLIGHRDFVKFCDPDPYDDFCRQLSRVWVHLMAHAATKCRPNVHAQQPSKGGELLTIIWLCIANFGDRKLNSQMTNRKLRI